MAIFELSGALAAELPELGIGPWTTAPGLPSFDADPAAESLWRVVLARDDEANRAALAAGERSVARTHAALDDLPRRLDRALARAFHELARAADSAESLPGAASVTAWSAGSRARPARADRRAPASEQTADANLIAAPVHHKLARAADSAESLPSAAPVMAWSADSRAKPAGTAPRAPAAARTAVANLIAALVHPELPPRADSAESLPGAVPVTAWSADSRAEPAGAAPRAPAAARTAEANLIAAPVHPELPPTADSAESLPVTPWSAGSRAEPAGADRRAPASEQTADANLIAALVHPELALPGADSLTAWSAGAPADRPAAQQLAWLERALDRIADLARGRARIETHLEGALVAHSLMTVSGDTELWIAPRLSAAGARLHARSVAVAVRTRHAWARILTRIATGCARIVALGLPAASVTALPAIWRFIRDVLREVRGWNPALRRA